MRTLSALFQVERPSVHARFLEVVFLDRPVVLFMVMCLVLAAMEEAGMRLRLRWYEAKILGRDTRLALDGLDRTGTDRRYRLSRQGLDSDQPAKLAKIAKRPHARGQPPVKTERLSS